MLFEGVCAYTVWCQIITEQHPRVVQEKKIPYFLFLVWVSSFVVIQEADLSLSDFVILRLGGCKQHVRLSLTVFTPRLQGQKCEAKISSFSKSTCGTEIRPGFMFSEMKPQPDTELENILSSLRQHVPPLLEGVMKEKDVERNVTGML